MSCQRIKRVIKRSKEDIEWDARRGLNELRQILPLHWVEHPRGVFKDPKTQTCVIPMTETDQSIRYHLSIGHRIYHVNELEELQSWIQSQ